MSSNDRAVALVKRASLFDVNAIRFKNPFVPLLRFTVGTGLEIIAQHQSRHLLQAEGVRGPLNFHADGSSATPVLADGEVVFRPPRRLCLYSARLIRALKLDGHDHRPEPSRSLLPFRQRVLA